MARRSIPGILAALALAGCGDAVGDYPALMPTDQLLAEPALPDHVPDAARSPAAVEAQAQTRAADLRRRAEALRGPVIEPDILSRMSPQD